MDLVQFCGLYPNLLHDILAAMQQALIVTDREGLILTANSAAEKITGYKQQELQSRNLSVFFTPEDLSFYYPNILELASRNMPFEGEALLSRKNETLFFAYLSVRPCQGGEGVDPVIAFSIQDIDKQKRLEKAFRESSYEDMIKVANGIAHELRNPLLGIGGFVNRLYRSCRAEPEDAKYYDYILENLKKLENLVRNVNLLVTLPKPVFKSESLADIVAAALAPFQETLEKRGMEYSAEFQDAIVPADRAMIVQALSILLSNALDAAPDGSRITIHSAAQENLFELCVTDNGSGISPTDLPFIFNPFFSTKADGVGIDLAVVKRIMESHGGRVGVRSKEGEETTFYLVFPLERRRAIRTAPI